jgi:hypothetical protein
VGASEGAVSVKLPTAWIGLLVLAFACPIAAQPVDDVTDLDLDGVPGIASPRDEIPPPVSSALVGTGTLLIDRTHGNSFNVSGFTNYLTSQGWVVLDLTMGPVTVEALEGADVFLVPTRAAGLGPISPFSEAEVAAVQAFLSYGRGLWVPHDFFDPVGINTLSTAFGVTYTYDSVRDFTDNEGEVFWPTVHLLTEHATTQGVKGYGYYLGECVGGGPPSSITASGDEDAFSLYCPVGTYPPTMAVWESTGRAVFVGDITTLSPQWYPNLLSAEEQLLLQNIANWLLGPPPNAVEAETWGRVKARFR